MRTKELLFAAAILLGAIEAKSQSANIPNGSGLPTGNLTGTVAYPRNFNQSPNSIPTSFSYIRTYTPIEPVPSISDFNSTASLNILVNTTYVDGFGAPVQSIVRTNKFTDIVKPYYNRPGRVTVDYLPYEASFNSKFQAAPFTTQKNYYLSRYSAEDTTAYSKTVSFSNNGMPTVETYSPGRAFVGQQRGVTTTFSFNKAAEVYIVNYSNGSVCTDGFYLAGTLQLTTTTGQHGLQTKSYTDKDGLLICKKEYAGIGSGNNGWLETYYVYNDLGKLVCMVPPKAAKQFANSNCLSDVAKLCFLYDYNKYGEVVTRSVPGKDSSEDLIYDMKHRPVLSQNAKLKADNKYLFTIYDKMNRPVMTGIYDNSNNNFSKTSLQNAVYTAQSLAPIITYVSTDFSGTYPSSIADCELYSYNYYDDLSLVPSTASSRTFDNSFSSDYLTANNMITPVASSFTYGKLVATKTKILDPNNIGTHFLNSWTTTVFFYDEQGRVIQSQTQNPWDTTNWDMATNQYDFVGHTVLNISTHHSWSGSNKAYTKLMTWNVYSVNTGEIMETRQKIDQQPWETIIKPQIDGLGSLQSQYLGGNIEEQDFSYNIRGQLTGINKGFITVPTLPSNRTFAERLSYESGFTDRRYDGCISGFEWKTSSSAQSAYGYKYDNLGRMTAADYRDYSTYTGVTSWNKNNRDFSVAALSYDENGNMLSMRQYGYDTLLHPALIDDLEYGYDAGNRLLTVSDLSLNKSPEDDFDNQRGMTTKYSYDAAGNLSEDTLKNLTISYDYFGRPQLIKNIHTGASIENLYDGNGSLVQKNVDNGNSNISVYTYWGPYVYKDDTLQYISHAMGRARWLADSNFFKYDYFVQDHLGNVRTVVTSDVTTLSSTYLATHEVASANIENAIFENLTKVTASKPAGSPSDVKCEMLTSDNEESRIGAAIVLRVMAGDKINAGVYSYHDVKESDDSYTTPEAMLSSVINVLAGGTGGFEGGEGGNGTEITNGLFSPDNYNAFEELKNNATYPDYPRAYLNYLVFDDEFNLVREESGAMQVSGNNNSWEYMALPSELTMSRNGYVALYLSNEESLPVFFDNLVITQHQGRLLEELHYYPHGLLVNKSVAAATKPVNKYQFQGNEMQDDLGMQLYDFHARQYDPQIGRFSAVDPLADYSQESLSPYHFCHNNPANFVDPWGLIDGRMVFDAVMGMLYGGQMEEFTLTAQADHPGTVHVDRSNGGGGGGGYGDSHTAPSGWNSFHGGGSGSSTGSHGSSGHSSSGSNGRITPTVPKTPPLKPKVDLKDYESQRSQMMRKIEPIQADDKWLTTEIADALSKGTIIPDASISLLKNSATIRELATGVSEATDDFARIMELSKPLTKGLTIVNTAATATVITNDISNGNYARGAARAGVEIGIYITTGICPPCGLTLGIANALWGDYLYEKIH